MTVLKLKTNISCHNTTRYCSTCSFRWDRVSESVSFLLCPPLLSHCSIFCCGAGTWLWIFCWEALPSSSPQRHGIFKLTRDLFWTPHTVDSGEESPVLQLCSNTALTASGKTEGWSQEPAGLGSAAPDWGLSTANSTSIAESSASQQNTICLLSADISYYGIGILSMINLSCESFPVKLTYISTSSPDQELQPTFLVSLMLSLIIKNLSLFIRNFGSELSLLLWAQLRLTCGGGVMQIRAVKM